MTAQVDDLFRHRDLEYAVAGISEGSLFDPSLLGLEPTATCTACWRGYQAVFGIADSRLVLDTLYVNLVEPGEGYERQEGPPINGVSPIEPSQEHDWFNNHYLGIDYRLQYSGGLLLAKGFIQDLYVHMGFHPPWKYADVVELVFDNGALQHEFDRSERMAQIRQALLDSQGRRPDRRTLEEIRDFVERSFDRSYSM